LQYNYLYKKCSMGTIVPRRRDHGLRQHTPGPLPVQLLRDYCHTPDRCASLPRGRRWTESETQRKTQPLRPGRFRSLTIGRRAIAALAAATRTSNRPREALKHSSHANNLSHRGSTGAASQRHGALGGRLFEGLVHLLERFVCAHLWVAGGRLSAVHLVHFDVAGAGLQRQSLAALVVTRHGL